MAASNVANRSTEARVLQPIRENSTGLEESELQARQPTPTEYGQSFSYARTRRPPRPRQPLCGWQTRNLSNIIPSGPEPPPIIHPQRSSQQAWPWQARQTNSQIFPNPTNQPPRQGVNNPERDGNNNPIQARNPPGRRAWPWQASAQRSTIFLQDAIQSNIPATERGDQSAPSHASRSESHPKWPWQDRARKSIIFELMTETPVQPETHHRTYQWNQRQSNAVRDAVHQQPLPPQNSSVSQKHAWPWQERAHQSVVFRSPDKNKSSNNRKYVWDQRKSRFTTNQDPEAKFPLGSHYTDNFVKWKASQGSMKPAGKPCYVDDEYQEKENVTPQKRHIKLVEPNEFENLLQNQPIPLNSPTASSIPLKRVQNCLELVPVDYEF